MLRAARLLAAHKALTARGSLPVREMVEARVMLSLARVPAPKSVALKCGGNRDISSLFLVACLSPSFVAKCDELRGQDTT